MSFIAGNKKIAAIDTSSKLMSLALCVHGRIIGEYRSNATMYHSERIIPAFKNLLLEHGWEKGPDALAVTIGPGSFTGIRIGITMARALAHGWQIPIMGVCSLDALAESAHDWDGEIYCLIDALRREVYAAHYIKNTKFHIKGSYRLIGIDALIGEFKKKGHDHLMCIGSGAVLYADVIRDRCGKKSVVVSDRQVPLSSGVAAIASRMNGNAARFSYKNIEPLYIRKLAVEERNLRKT